MAASKESVASDFMNQDDEQKLLDAFSRVLRELRTQSSLSQEELAHRAGKSIRYISLLESRKHQPSLGTLKKICDGLGVSMTEFIGKIESQ